MIKNLNDPWLPIQLRIYMDEAGRGPLAGPVWVGCTIQTGNVDMKDFRDSKVLSAKKRELTYQTIQRLEAEKKLIYGSGLASAKEIDEYGIIGSLQLAGVRSLYLTILKWYEIILKPKLLESVRGEDMLFMVQIEHLLDGLERYQQKENHLYTSEFERNTAKLQFLRHFFMLPQKQFVYKGLFLDGNHTFGLDKLLGLKMQTIIKGDAKVPLISAASIVAKVERDEYMARLDSDYPGWSFGRHKGYGTANHREMIVRRAKQASKKINTKGLTSEHRVSYLQYILKST